LIVYPHFVAWAAENRDPTALGQVPIFQDLPLNIISPKALPQADYKEYNPSPLGKESWFDLRLFTIEHHITLT
jgi:hypothetical protein